MQRLNRRACQLGKPISMRRYFLYFLVVLSCFSCEKESSSHFIMAENDCNETRLNGKRIELCLNKIEDSRCCIYCYCIWQGVATASFTLKMNDQNITFQLHTLDNPSPYKTDTTIMGYNIKLLKITPYPGESSEPKKAEVVITRQ
jgi:hypothetical protein